MWYLRWMFDLFGAIPVRPGGVNREGISAAVKALRLGRVVCIFPEGGANPRIPLKHLLPGAAALSLKTGAFVMPFRITGVWPFDQQHLLRQFLQRGRARIRMGEVMSPVGQAEDRSAIRYWTEAIRAALLARAFLSR